MWAASSNFVDERSSWEICSLCLCLSLSCLSAWFLSPAKYALEYEQTENRDEEGGVMRMHAREPQRSSIPWRDWDSTLSAIDANTAHRCDFPDTPLYANFQSHHRSQQCQMLSKLYARKERRSRAEEFWLLRILRMIIRIERVTRERERERERERAQDFPPFPPTDLFPGPAFEALHCCT
jgi:hypothetical protein